MIKHNYGAGPGFTTDACIAGYGLWTGMDWQAGCFNSTFDPAIDSLDPTHSHWVNIHVDDSASSNNINVLELIPVWLCLIRCAHQWRDLHVVCHTDNSSVMAMINKGFSSNNLCMAILRDIFWRCAVYNIHITARHIPGSDNIVADLLSRIYLLKDWSVLDHFFLCCSPKETTSGHGTVGQPNGPHYSFGVG